MKKLVGIAVSLAILAVIYWQIDVDRLLAVLAESDALWMVVALGMVVPLTAITAWRLTLLMPREGRLGFGTSVRLVLMASVLNMVLPSKMGDIAKAYVMTERGHMEGRFAVSLVVFEKAWDMLALLVWCVFGLVLFPSKGPLFWGLTALVAGLTAFMVLMVASPGFARLSLGLMAAKAPGKIGAKIAGIRDAWLETQAYFWRDRGRAAGMIGLSVFLWFGHLMQIWLFILALNAFAPLVDSLALTPLALLVGLMPLTFAGVGTRDAALILFYAPYFAAPTAAALGLLCTLRYLMPALAGLPFLGGYLATLRRARQQAPAAP